MNHREYLIVLNVSISSNNHNVILKIEQMNNHAMQAIILKLNIAARETGNIMQVNFQTNTPYNCVTILYISSYISLVPVTLSAFPLAKHQKIIK